MVKIRNLYKTYDGNVEALKGINLDIETGTIFGIIGTSGAGKSSLVRCMNLLEKPTSGEMTINGIDMISIENAELREARKNIGMVFQHFNLLSSKTVFDNIAFPMKISKMSKEDINKKVTELLELVDLADKRDMYPAQLSGGQKQRVGIARAIATNPAIVICDEATSALDPTTTESILNLLQVINEKLNMTIIIITHEMNVIKKICDEVAVIENGRILESGKVLELTTKPKTVTAKTFFQTVDPDMLTKVVSKEADSNSKIYKAIFIGENSYDSFIYQIIKRFNVEVSVLLGNIEEINKTVVGTLVIKIKGDFEMIENSVRYLENNEIVVEEIK